MTEYADRHVHKVEWLNGDGWVPYCQHCVHWEETYCDNIESDHYYHVLHSEHYACKHFKEN